jgi:hypothetical protein
MHVEITLTARYSGVRHSYTFIGGTEQRTIFPKSMEQGGEHYRVGWDDVPEDIESELDEMGEWEFVEE